MTTINIDETIKQILKITKANPEVINENPLYERTPEYLNKLLQVVKLLK